LGHPRHREEEFVCRRFGIATPTSSFRGARKREPGIQATHQSLDSGFRLRRPRNDGVLIGNDTPPAPDFVHAQSGLLSAHRLSASACPSGSRIAATSGVAS
jgi:hypothetical protein